MRCRLRSISTIRRSTSGAAQPGRSTSGGEPARIHLPDGNVLIVNGELFPAADPAKAQNAPTILDPRTGATAKGKAEDLSSTRGYHNVATLLPDGRVFVAGGRTYRVVDEPDERTDGRFYSPYYLGILPPK